jgi:hypothetical protein
MAGRADHLSACAQPNIARAARLGFDACAVRALNAGQREGRPA